VPVVSGTSGRSGRSRVTVVDVDCTPGRQGERGWVCSVSVRDGDRQLSSHRVRVDGRDLDRLVPGDADPTRLVEASFGFLLEREPPSSILRSFDLMEIERYFPEYTREIRKQLAR
jgi:hypothetical protein